MNFILWKNVEIPDFDCVKNNKKCTPDCPLYDMGWIQQRTEVDSRDQVQGEGRGWLNVPVLPDKHNVLQQRVGFGNDPALLLYRAFTLYD